MWIGATVLAIVAVLALVGCGGGSANSVSTNAASSVPAAHYNVVVTAASGNLQQSTTLDVTVN
jgi:ABC-type glycerol-3-phosphate transport system substrate-binding protein